MKPKVLCSTLLLAVVMTGPQAPAADPGPPEALTLHTRTRVAVPKGSWQYQPVHRTLRWDPKKTAIVICDMWDEHWCKSATARVAEMAPRMNRLIGQAREKGVLIIDARQHRTQKQNRDEAIERLIALIRRAAPPPKRRRKTRPTAASRKKRLESKRRRSQTKHLRRHPGRDD